MRKKRIFKKNKINPDPKYKSELVEKFVNHIMYDGKKLTAYNIFYSAMDIIKEKTEQEGLDVLMTALEHVCPTVETKRRRIGGATVQVPVEIYKERSQYLGMSWLIKYARERSDKTMKCKLASELIAALNNEGKAVKRKEEVHKMAASNNASASLKF